MFGQLDVYKSIFSTLNFISENTDQITPKKN